MKKKKKIRTTETAEVKNSMMAFVYLCKTQYNNNN